jgi:hypothetical protein
LLSVSQHKPPQQQHRTRHLIEIEEVVEQPTPPAKQPNRTRKHDHVPVDIKTLSKRDRAKYVWGGVKHIKLTGNNKQDLETLYTERDVRLIPNPFSLSSTLTLYPELRDSYVPDWTDDQQLSFVDISNRPALYLVAVKDIDPWS